MKHNLQKRILLPFIGFTIVLTTLLVTWSSLFISSIVTNKDTENLSIQLQYLNKHFSTVLNANKLFFSTLKKEKDFYQSLSKYRLSSLNTNQYKLHKENLNATYFTALNTQNRNPFISPVITKEGSKMALIFHSKKSNPFIIEYQLFPDLSAIATQPGFIYGLIYFNPENPTQIKPFIKIENSQNISLDTSTIHKAFLSYIHTNPQSNILIKKPLKVTFQKSQDIPHLYYVIGTSSSTYIKTLTKIVCGVLAVIVLFSASIFFIYNLIIKKMTTSIDILRSVSKKVAKGDFTQKVFIDTQDEIGELATTFNKMVSQLKIFSENLVQQKDQSDAIVDCIPDGIIVTNLNNSLIVANKKAETIFNFKSKKKTRSALDKFVSHPSFKEHSKVVKKESQYTSEFIYKMDDTDHIFLMTSTVVKNTHQKPIGIVYLIRNITHERQIDQLREGFLRTVSHELRTPLTSVIGFIDLVKQQNKDTLNTESQTCLTTALTEAQSLKRLIDDLLELSQMQAKKANMSFTPITVYDLANNIIQSLSPLIKSKPIALINAVNDPTLMIHADETKLRRILVNLVSNSIKFTQQGSIKISCIDTESHLEFSVSDTGIGLKDSEKNVIFEKFRQIDYSSTREYEGIGLGLSIVKELVELHSGSVRVESTLGTGSTFIFTIEKKRDLTATLVT